MYDNCNQCPCYERRKHQTSNSYTEENFCFWYDRPIYPMTDTCGNHFEERPEKNQEQLEDLIRTDEVITAQSIVFDLLFKEFDGNIEFGDFGEDKKEAIITTKDGRTVKVTIT